MKVGSNTEQLKHVDLTEAIIGAFYDVFNELGHGFLESVYREAMIVALRRKGLAVERDKSVEVREIGACFRLS